MHHSISQNNILLSNIVLRIFVPFRAMKAYSNNHNKLIIVLKPTSAPSNILHFLILTLANVKLCQSMPWRHIEQYKETNLLNPATAASNIMHS